MLQATICVTKEVTVWQDGSDVQQSINVLPTVMGIRVGGLYLEPWSSQSASQSPLFIYQEPREIQPPCTFHVRSRLSGCINRLMWQHPLQFPGGCFQGVTHTQSTVETAKITHTVVMSLTLFNFASTAFSVGTTGVKLTRLLKSFSYIHLHWLEQGALFIKIGRPLLVHVF